MRTEATIKSHKQPSANKQSHPVKHDAIVLLKQDHDEVKKMFKQYQKLAQKGDTDGKVLIANKICAELIAHTIAEEEIFYPAARQAIHEDGMFNEAKVEHDSAKDLIAQIQSMTPEDPMYDAKVTVLGEYIEHHVEEEESEMFPMVRKSKKVDLRQMGSLLASRKEEVMQELCDMQGEIDTQQLQAKLGMKAKH